MLIQTQSGVVEGLTHDPGNAEGLGCDSYSMECQYFESDKDLYRDHSFGGGLVGNGIGWKLDGGPGIVVALDRGCGGFMLSSEVEMILMFCTLLDIISVNSLQTSSSLFFSRRTDFPTSSYKR